MSEARPNHWLLSITCDDRAGIVHAMTGAIVQAEGNITELQQFSSADTGRFFMRVQVETEAGRDAMVAAFGPVFERYGMDWTLDEVGRPLRTLVLVSKAGHCLGDLLYRRRAGQLSIDVPIVLGNHPDLAGLAELYDVPFEWMPVTGPDEKAAFEARVRELVAEHDIELTVLARYMQILSPELCDELSGRAINIHHSFLPGFKGAKPYHQAYARGVKIIGATAHYATGDLDEGPIIEQDVQRVDHTMLPDDLVEIGHDLEAVVLNRAVRWHAEHRVFVTDNRTIVLRS